MTQEEIIQEMQSGKFARWEYFKDDEWMTISRGKILFEDGVRMPIHEFFERSKEGFSVVDVPTFEKDGKRYVTIDGVIQRGDMMLINNPDPNCPTTNRVEKCDCSTYIDGLGICYQFIHVEGEVRYHSVAFPKSLCKKLMRV